MMRATLRSTAGAAMVMALWGGTALGSPSGVTAGLVAPLFGQAGAGLVAPGGVEGMAKPAKQLPAGAQKMADNFNKAGTADAVVPAEAPADAAAPVTSVSTATLLKYAPSYVLMVLSISLGLFIVCRPTGFGLTSLAEKKKQKK